MNGENIPLLAYFFVGVTSLVLAYVTYSDEIDKIPGQVKQTLESTSSSTLSNPSSTSENNSSSLTALNPLAPTEQNTGSNPNVIGGKKKHKKTKRHHSKAKHNKSKHNKSKK